MDERWNALGGRLVATIGLLAGALAGATAFVVVGSAVAQRGADSTGPFVEATHVPPLLTAEGELVDLSYDTYCIDPESEEAEGSCAPTGSVFIRSGAKGQFRDLPLLSDGTASRLVAHVPEAIASSRTGSRTTRRSRQSQGELA